MIVVSNTTPWCNPQNFGRLLEAYLYRIGGAAVHLQFQLNLASSGQIVWQKRVDLIEADEASLGAGVQHLRASAANHQRHRRQVAAIPDSSAVQNQEDLIGGGAKINRDGYEFA